MLSSDDGNIAIKWIRVVDRLNLDQRALARERAAHGAEARRFTDLAQGFERGPLGAIGLAMDELEGQVAADQKPPLPRQRFIEGGRERADGSDRSDAERNA